jgi:general stress protein 26
MKLLLKSSVFVSLLLMLFTTGSFSQQDVNKDNQLLKAAREIIADAGTCALITLDEKGSPRVRAMDPFPPEDDFTIWFGTNKESRKVEQIKKDPRVNLYYIESDQSSYVTLFGEAVLVNDPEEKKNHWKKEWEAFYGKDKENYMLIKVTPVWLEVSSAKRGLNGDTASWAPPGVDFRK